MERDRIRSACGFALPATISVGLVAWTLPLRGNGDVGLTSTHRRTRADNCQSHCRASPRGDSAVCLGGWADGRMLPLPLKGLGSLVVGWEEDVVALIGFPCEMASIRAPRNAVRMYTEITGYETDDTGPVYSLGAGSFHDRHAIRILSRTHLINGQKISTTSHPVLSTA